MVACVTRVSSASVKIDGKVFSEMSRGLLILLGVRKGDSFGDAEYLAAKCCGLRIFEDEAGRMNIDAAEAGGEIMVVTNFTLCGDAKKGKRPSFDGAERPEKAEPLADTFCSACEDLGFKVHTGVFGADMKVESVNDGPVTLILDTAQMRPHI